MGLKEEKRKVQEDELMSLAELMMNRKRNQLVEKGSCLCERVRNGHKYKGDGKDEGDRYCGLVRVESDGELPVQAIESDVGKNEVAAQNPVITVRNRNGGADSPEEASQVVEAKGCLESMYWRDDQ